MTFKRETTWAVAGFAEDANAYEALTDQKQLLTASTFMGGGPSNPKERA
jgi:hypothetical protein